MTEQIQFDSRAWHWSEHELVSYKLWVHRCQAQKTFEIWPSPGCHLAIIWPSPDPLKTLSQGPLLKFSELSQELIRSWDRTLSLTLLIVFKFYWHIPHLLLLTFSFLFSDYNTADLVWHKDAHAWVPAVKMNIKHDDTVAKLCHFLPGKEDHYDNKTINQFISNAMKSWNIKRSFLL